MNIVLGEKTLIFLFAEKPAIAPPVFVFQKDKGQKVRGSYVLSSRLFSPRDLPGSHSRGCFCPLNLTLSWEDEGPMAFGSRGERLRWVCVERAQRPCF